MMNKCVLLCCVLAAWFVSESIAAYTYTDSQKSMIQSKLLATGVKCIKEYPLSMSDFKTFKNKMVPDTNNGKCFLACLFKDNGIIDDMGKLSPKGAQEKAEEVFQGEEERLKSIIQLMEHCSSVNEEPTSDGDKGCDRAKLALNCLVENAAKYGFDTDF